MDVDVSKGESHLGASYDGAVQQLLREASSQRIRFWIKFSGHQLFRRDIAYSFRGNGDVEVEGPGEDRSMMICARFLHYTYMASSFIIVDPQTESDKGPF